MISKEFRISNRLGLHARPSAQLTQVAGKFASEVYIAKNGRRVNAKSIMGVMMLAAGKGTSIDIAANGADEQSAVDELTRLVLDRFGEAE